MLDLPSQRGVQTARRGLVNPRHYGNIPMSQNKFNSVLFWQKQFAILVPM